MIGAAAPSPSDLAIKSRIEGRGSVVTMIADTKVEPSIVDGKDLLIISSSADKHAKNANGEPMEFMFVDNKAPVLLLLSYIGDEFGMVNTVENEDYGFVPLQTQVTITNAAHPMAAGLNGTITVASAPTDLMFSLPGANAATIATAVGDPKKPAIYAYKTGDMMASRTAPGKRIGWFLSATMMLTADGLKLFDAAFDWATAN